MTMGLCVKKIKLNEDFWMRHSLIALFSWYVIILLDEQNPTHIENLRIITPFISKWNEAEIKSKQEKISEDDINEDIDIEEDDDSNDYINIKYINNNNDDELEEFYDESSEKKSNKEVEDKMEFDWNNTDSNEDINIEYINNNNEEELEENDDEDDEMEFEEPDDEEFEDPSSIHRITEGVNNHWSFNFQEDHSSLKDLNGFNF
ncbi:hypothetical protein CL6EHI_020850 [Entamoeba histolytica]|uniref:Uncharacterized protein n=2 Tax=Entamoeba histolytica TaxID=5759 RepID=C4M860_ENTH1|nr:hypothetical protein EHI_020850 [Entamoeba histolytica HM-1:IMSS]EAL43410.2 hypothetical protein EHI_020850 [Entamoeba histolytica HM-1:IMSS]GAT97756.1 hypothetical protein CL6EHI_020850 [Entamoeba histolytica]|eukprot:XP_648796.2 hypothetical protein EHI_020850 [Entamoeba histolytica HM-1:IMSS]